MGEPEKKIQIESYERDGVTFTCEQTYYVGADGLLYESDDLIDENLLKRQDGFRKATGLLTSKEIKEIRNSYHLSQKEFSLVLGMGEVNVARYETKLCQTKAMNDLLIQARDNPLWFFEKFTNSHLVLPKGKAEEVVSAISQHASKPQQKEKETTEYLKTLFLPYLDEPEFTGGVCLNLEKIASIVFKANEKEGPIYKTKLAKLLFYCDFLSQKELGHGITGLVYTREPFGALPLDFQQVLSHPYFSVEEEVSSFDENMFSFLITSKLTNSFLSNEENAVVKKVLERFKGSSTQDIVETMHREEAYLQTKENHPIDYCLSKKIKDF